MSLYPHSADSIGSVAAPVETVFEFLDDHSNLSRHMGKSSWMMLGTSMDIYMDSRRTRAVGSRFGFRGRILGIPLWVDEVVTIRDPPIRKIWEAIGELHLWVIGRYKMGFELTAEPGGTTLRVFIEYERPVDGFPRLMGILLGGTYARWCTRQMVTDAQKHFGGPTAPGAPPTGGTARK
ncbi:SRPBCC family protein [Pararhizobium sp. LjRoot235]|uniref:SRPBCC family protein n=1 Tax=Pararhizobium sp. LjRoot235 TaxID=3342291 RepID=UPI003ED0A6C8